MDGLIGFLRDLDRDGAILCGWFLAYFLPAIIARMRHHRQRGAITLLNLLTGWTVIGWIVAAVWSVAAFDRAPAP